MSNVIDLSTIVKEDLVFKVPNGDEIRIPGQIPLDFVLKISKQQEKLAKVETFEEQVKIMKGIVLEILKLNTTVKVDMKYVDEHLSDITIMKVIMEATMKHIEDVISDENL